MGNFGTFWYLRHLGPPGLLENVKDLICDFLKLKEVEGERLPYTPLNPPYTLWHPQTPLDTPKHPQLPQTHSPVPQEQPWLLQSTRQTVDEAFELSRDVKRDSGRIEHVRRCLLSVRNVCECLRLPLAMSWICQGWYGSDWRYLRVSGGSWRVEGGWGGYLVVFSPSISFNFRKSQMRSLTFSRRPGGPKCLKYQNVPKLPTFWPFGKPR